MHNILQHLFQKNSVQEVEGEALEDLAREFPYFAPAHLLLARKQQQGEPAVYDAQFQKALLYFPNPLWLKYQLTLPADHPTAVISDVDDQVEAEILPSPGVPVHWPDMIEDVLLHPEKSYDTDGPEIQSRGFDNIDRDLSQSASELSGRLHRGQSAGTLENNQQAGLSGDPAARDSPSGSDEEAEADDEVESPETGDLPLQAFHTVDYFASQGIRLSQEALSNDKLGKQLKSFTEWLKTMRRLPEPVAEEVLEKTNDSDVAKYAAHSLVEKEVVTEAMAEVLMKQGKTEKAVEVYHKLSLLNQHKSAYFAAKIEALKKH